MAIIKDKEKIYIEEKGNMLLFQITVSPDYTLQF